MIQIPRSTTGRRKEIGKLFIALFITILSTGCLADPLQDEQLLSDYHITIDKSTPASKAKIVTKQERNYRTIFGDSLKYHVVEFAGHYRMINIGCATACVTGGVVDTRNGDIVWFPFNQLEEIPGNFWHSMIFCRNSSLIIFDGAFNGDLSPVRKYYTISEGEFKLLRTSAAASITDPETPGHMPDWAKNHRTDPAYCDPGMAP